MDDEQNVLATVWPEVVAELTTGSADGAIPAVSRAQQAWLKLVKPLTVAQGFALLSVPSSLAQEAIERDLREPILRSLGRRLGPQVEGLGVRIAAPSPAAGERAGSSPRHARMTSRPERPREQARPPSGYPGPDFGVPDYAARGEYGRPRYGAGEYPGGAGEYGNDYPAGAEYPATGDYGSGYGGRDYPGQPGEYGERPDYQSHREYPADTEYRQPDTDYRQPEPEYRQPEPEYQQQPDFPQQAEYAQTPDYSQNPEFGAERPEFPGTDFEPTAVYPVPDYAGGEFGGRGEFRGGRPEPRPAEPAQQARREPSGSPRREHIPPGQESLFTPDPPPQRAPSRGRAPQPEEPLAARVEEPVVEAAPEPLRPGTPGAEPAEDEPVVDARNNWPTYFNKSPEAPPQASSSASLNAKYTFETFVIGASNRFAHAAAVAIAEAPARAYNPLFVWGASGLGKTHLLHAAGHYAQRLFPGMRVKYVSTEEFTNDFINSLRDDRKVAFKRRYRETDILLVDDIQFIEGKEGIQEEFFHTFNTLHNANKQIVVSSDRPPKQLATLEERLRTRFEWGLITDVQPPELETRIAILRKKARMDRLDVPHDVLELIASRVERNIRELEGALIRVTAFASLNGQPLDLSLAEVVLRDLMPDTAALEINAATIMAVTAEYFNTTLEELTGPGKARPLAQARQIAMYLCRELTDLSLPKIGQAFGRDHTTVMYAEKKVRKEMTERRRVYDQVQELTARIKQRSR
ncbi:chromosomal replication initiator protein DnaA [Nocardia asteroides NBRC 15531]|uniref:Chromosomal replication initiator protein DnaA n=1 Tax=Nocardia asteroides NBRC 15531 TaxID=1110697 RepID=U5EFM3_NOCAS|nr:chromosomal replication initiator protein DnaA [Nocardia asteroides]TLF69060.1 chromosomal replication initiator protein DnaA [Nocardia asteroides NBRC 15531]UGT48535.1 chromosomal replication initiator protein DnaA [Nocardia asteroides]SFL62915.1 chromosomal replication initiator protein [Nocardia asteroides]VEG32038.1 Chromosomal replication initiator protein DnaA [Nocardia asteroides]GAD85203.1 chromosomal replication initiator protein DnaA [Nocardia asteroides NBRC 15531]